MKFSVYCSNLVIDFWRSLIESGLFTYFVICIIPQIDAKLIPGLSYSIIFIPTLQAMSEQVHCQKLITRYSLWYGLWRYSLCLQGYSSINRQTLYRSNSDTDKQLFYPLENNSNIKSVALSIGTILFRVLRLIFLLGHFVLLGYCCYLQESWCAGKWTLIVLWNLTHNNDSLTGNNSMSIFA